MHILTPSALAICLYDASRAWFSASSTTETTAIQSSSYGIPCQSGEGAAAIEPAETSALYTPTEGTRAIKLKAIEAAGATGYCSDFGFPWENNKISSTQPPDLKSGGCVDGYSLLQTSRIGPSMRVKI